MKKILAIVGVAALTLSSSYAQGTINTLSPAGYISTNGAAASQGIGLTQGNGFYYALFVDNTTPSSANPLTGGWTYSGVMMTNVNGGLLNGGATVTVPSTPGWALNTFVNYLIVGWSINGGQYSTWSSVSAALSNGLTGAGLANGTYYGVSAIGNAEPGGGTPSLPVWHLFGTTGSAQGTPVGGFQLDIVATPEPGTLALAALGGASLLMFRRKK